MKALKSLQILVPKSLKPKGTAYTPTYSKENAKDVLKFPDYQEHKIDLFDLRVAKNSQELLGDIFAQDPDLSNTVWSFLTVANTQPLILAKDPEDQLDRDALKLCKQLLTGLTTTTDYTLGFQRKKSLRTYAEEIRHMLLLRGSAGVEAIYNELYTLSDLRNIDMYTVRWNEKQNGIYKPQQEIGDVIVKLDVPQQVINDLYRIMQITGYPRMDVKILEEVLLKNAPKDVIANKELRQQYIGSALSQVTSQFYNLRPDLPAVHLDSVELSMVNDKSPGMAVDISHVIKVLDAQKQSGLHTLSTILGRGESGVNTATVEARLFTMSAAALNGPVADLLSAILTQAVRIAGSQSRIEVIFPEPELRSQDEREAQIVLRQQRLRSDLSYGLITDDEYHIRMYGRLAPEGTEQLSGTLFEQGGGMEVDAGKVSPNSDPIGRSVSQATDKSAKSNSVASSKKSRTKA